MRPVAQSLQKYVFQHIIGYSKEASPTLHICATLYSTGATFSQAKFVERKDEAERLSPMVSREVDDRRYTVEDFRHLATDRITKERIRNLLRQHKLLLRHSKPAPLYLSSEDILALLSQPSRNKRCRYFQYLSYKEAQRTRKLKAVPNFTQVPADRCEWPRKWEFIPHTADRCDDYGLHRNTILMRILDAAMSIYYESRQIPAILFGQKLVFDLDFDQYMTPRESNKAAVDLKAAYGWNRRNRHPFDLYFCNANISNPTARLMNDCLFGVRKHPVLTEFTEQSYLELFPREKLVYLSPDGDETLNVFDHDVVYVIGVLVDKQTKDGITYAKAKSEGLRTVRFPQRFCLQWEAGLNRALHITDVIKVLLELKRTNNWTCALRYINKQLKVDESCQETL